MYYALYRNDKPIIKTIAKKSELTWKKLGRYNLGLQDWQYSYQEMTDEGYTCHPIEITQLTNTTYDET